MDILIQKARELWHSTFQKVERALLSADMMVRSNVYQVVGLSFAFGLLLSLLLAWLV